MIHENLANYFKAEIRRRGQEDYAKELGYISNGSDTLIQGFVKSTPPLRVALAAKTIADQEMTASCSCRAGAKGSTCKHIWTILLATEANYPDFLDVKKTISMAPAQNATKAEAPYKAKQADFKKAQYERQKQWVKEKNAAKKLKAEPPRERLPAAIEEAFEFFSQNGFSMENNRDEETLKVAMKTLARIFHPDKGGTHEEAVVLNSHYATLTRFFTK